MQLKEVREIVWGMSNAIWSNVVKAVIIKMLNGMFHVWCQFKLYEEWDFASFGVKCGYGVILY